MLRSVQIIVAVLLMTTQASAHGHGNATAHGNHQGHKPEGHPHKQPKAKSHKKTSKSKSFNREGPDATPNSERRGGPLPDGGRIDDPIAGTAGDHPDDADDQRP